MRTKVTIKEMAVYEVVVEHDDDATPADIEKEGMLDFLNRDDVRSCFVCVEERMAYKGGVYDPPATDDEHT